nr:uncharacterized protein LOC125626094 [Caretta caretta]
MPRAWSVGAIHMGTRQGMGNSPGAGSNPDQVRRDPRAGVGGDPRAYRRVGVTGRALTDPLHFCSPPPAAYVGVSRGCLVLALVASYLSVVCGALALAPRPAPKRLDWARGAAALCFLTGTLAVVALGCFMGGSAGEAGGSWAWSLAVGWAAVPAAGLAGERPGGEAGGGTEEKRLSATLTPPICSRHLPLPGPAEGATLAQRPERIARLGVMPPKALGAPVWPPKRSY